MTEQNYPFIDEEWQAFIHAVKTDDVSLAQSLYPKLKIKHRYEAFDFVKSEDMAELLLSCGEVIRPEAPYQRSQLFGCAPGMAQFFIDQGLSPRHSSGEYGRIGGTQALHFAQGRKNVETLIKHDGFFENAIFDVPCLEAAQALLEYDRNPQYTDRNKQSALHSQMKHPKIAHLLVENGWDIHQKDIHLETPLFYHIYAHLVAARTQELWEQHFTTLRDFLARGAALCILNFEGRNVLHKIAEQPDFHEGYIQRGIRMDEEHIQELVSFLCQNGLNVNMWDQCRRTPFHLMQTEKVARALIKQGADLNIQDEFGDTPLHAATDSAIVQALLNAGADADIKNSLGKLPCEEADSKGFTEKAALIRQTRITRLQEKMEKDFNNGQASRKEFKM